LTIGKNGAGGICHHRNRFTQTAPQPREKTVMSATVNHQKNAAGFQPAAGNGTPGIERAALFPAGDGCLTV